MAKKDEAETPTPWATEAQRMVRLRAQAEALGVVPPSGEQSEAHGEICKTDPCQACELEHLRAMRSKLLTAAGVALDAIDTRNSPAKMDRASAALRVAMDADRGQRPHMYDVGVLVPEPPDRAPAWKKIGADYAAALFDKRSRKSQGYRNAEVHLREDDLAQLLAQAARAGAKRARVLLLQAARWDPVDGERPESTDGY